MKRVQLFLCSLVAMFMLSANSAWAQYVKVTDEDGTVSWIEIDGIINGTNIEISTGSDNSAIDSNTEGSIDLNEVWSRSGGRGTHYQVTSIGENAFSGCGALTTVVIPSSVTNIGQAAFNGCNLTSVEIPSSVTTIGLAAFSNCSGLSSIVVDSSNSVYDSRNNCNAIIETATNDLITGCKNTKIPSSVMSITPQAFKGCLGLTSIEIPSGVAYIGFQAFEDCSRLTSIKIPSSVTFIGYLSFGCCSGLTSIEIPSSITSIEDYVFAGCSGLTSITIPSSVTSIGSGAFNGCRDLTSIEIPSSITSIDNYAFGECSSLTSITIPSSVTHIGNTAFYGCSGLTSIEIPSSVTSIGASAFSECSGLSSIVVESGNSVYDSRNNCNAIIETATNTLIKGCENTKIPSSVTSIGVGAFSSCSGMTSIEIPSSVTSIGNSAFYGCLGLTSITSYITDVFETGNGAFSYCDKATLYVPAGLVNTYRSTKDWNRFSKIEEIPGIALAMSCNNKGKVKVNGGVQFTNNIGEVSVYDGMESTFTFQPNENCELRQVLIDGLDVTLSVENNQLTTKVNEGSKMIVMFDNKGSDVNGDGTVDISDVVKLVNIILGQ